MIHGDRKGGSLKETPSAHLAEVIEPSLMHFMLLFAIPELRDHKIEEKIASDNPNFSLPIKG